ncbi:MAG: hypothetical protein ACJ76Y_28340 [Thermoanaerobaculia bacterium]
MTNKGPGPNPVSLFASLSHIVSVTFNEYFMYGPLVKFWAETKGSLPKERKDKLSINITNSGQLLVRWQGNRQTSRRLILVAHVDQEGFLLQRFSPHDKECQAIPSNDETTFENEKIGERVTIIARHGEYEGKIKHIDRETTPARITFSVDTRVGPERPDFRECDKFSAIAVYRLPGFNIDDDGIIEAPCVDNRAGVSVVTSVLEGLCAADWEVNVDVLYTTCEEAGFCGTVRHILAHPELIANDDLTWIVVDSSNKNKCLVENLPHDLRHPFDLGRMREEEVVIDLPCAVIRTGDKHHCFSRQVAQMLHAASLNASRKIGLATLYPGQCKLQEEFTFCNPDAMKFIRQDAASVAGARMIGGWCDASPIFLSPKIIESADSLSLAGSPRIGSLAIPLSNHRNTFEGRVLPERCHAAALVMSMVILAEAAKVDWRFPYLDRKGRKNLDDYPDLCESEARDVAQLKVWLAASKDYFSATDSWLAEARDLLRPHAGIAR